MRNLKLNLKLTWVTALAGLTMMHTAPVAQAQTGDLLSVEKIQSDIALAKEAYLRIHPGYTRYASSNDMTTAWDELEARAQARGGLRLDEFYLGVQDVLTNIRCDHTKAELPKSLIDIRKSNPVYLPVRWSVIEGRGLVRLADQGSGLSRGDEILEIDNRPLSEMMDEVDDYIPVDGYTEWSRTSGISESLEFRGGAVDHFGALLWDIQPQAKLLIETSSGETKTVQVQRVHYDDWRALGQQDGVAANFADAVTFDRIGDKGAYLRIDTFVNYRKPVDPDQIYDPIFNALKSENREYLILDLRQNGGGSHDASRGLLNRIMTVRKDFNQDVRVNTLDLDGLKEHLSTWEKRALNPNPLAFKKNDDGTYSFRKFAGQHGKIRPKRNAFEGKLIVLTSHSNSSGSAAILAHLKDTGRATFIGEKAGGSAEGATAGVLFTLTLPESGIRTRIPVIRAYHNIQSFEPGLSVSPDIKAPMTVEAFREGRDPAFEAALKSIK